MIIVRNFLQNYLINGLKDSDWEGFMGREAGIEINCSRYSKDIVKVIELLFEIGWKPYDTDNRITYLPIGDKGDYAWECGLISLDALCEVIKKKQLLQETIGLVLYYEKTGYGITILAKDTEEFSFGLDINRKTYGTSRESITDVGWYFCNTVNRMVEKGCTIDHIRFQEYMD